MRRQRIIAMHRAAIARSALPPHVLCRIMHVVRAPGGADHVSHKAVWPGIEKRRPECDGERILRRGSHARQHSEPKERQLGMGPKDDPAAPTFRPSREGLAQVLGELEAEIMEFVWREAVTPLPARAVADRVGKARGVQYITVVTVLNNLCRKGLLQREREGRAFQYEPALTRDEFVAQVSREVLSGVLRLGPELAVNSFVDALAEVDPGELRRLRERLDARRRSDKEG